MDKPAELFFGRSFHQNMDVVDHQAQPDDTDAASSRRHRDNGEKYQAIPPGIENQITIMSSLIDVLNSTLPERYPSLHIAPFLAPTKII